MTKLESLENAKKGLCSAVILQALNDTLTKKITCKDGKYQEAYRNGNKREARNFLQGKDVDLWIRWGELGLNIPHVKKVARYRKDYLKIKIAKAERRVAENNKEIRNHTAYRIALDKTA